jgi:hypothetical protein
MFPLRDLASFFRSLVESGVLAGSADCTDLRDLPLSPGWVTGWDLAAAPDSVGTDGEASARIGEETGEAAVTPDVPVGFGESAGGASDR